MAATLTLSALPASPAPPARVALDYATELNAEQYAVATAPGGPLLVVAGAGSGKTRALTYRVAWLIEHGVPPHRIVLVTFTNRAAREMLHRAAELLGQDLAGLWGGTFHHLANRVLRQHGALLGLRPDFTILDREDSQSLLSACVTDLGLRRAAKASGQRFPQKGVLAAMSSFVQNTLTPLAEVLPRRFPYFVDLEQPIGQVLALYGERKRRQQLLDFDDLLTTWLALLAQHEGVRRGLAEQFLHILVDEYQDTNAVQGQIVELLAGTHRNLCVVGDDAQSIYSFRGADFENLMGFQHAWPGCTLYKLETNYRSVPEILALANASIAHNERRLPKELRAVRAAGRPPTRVHCRDHRQQAEFVANEVQRRHAAGQPLRHLAVLYRSHWHSLDLQLALQERGVPFQVRGGMRFFEQAHVKDLLAHVRVLHNPQDELAWRRLLPLLPRVGPGLAQKLWTRLATSAAPVATLAEPATHRLVPAGARPGLALLAPHEAGKRRLLACAVCGTRWSYRRLGCPFCGTEQPDRLDALEIEGEEGVRLDACRACGGYWKTVTADADAAFLLADWSTLHLDVLARERGLERKGASLFEV